MDELKVDHKLKLHTNKRNTEMHNLIFSHFTVLLDFKSHHLFSEIMLNEIPVLSRKSEAIYNSYKVSFQAEKKGTAEELKLVLRRLRFLSLYPF